MKRGWVAALALMPLLGVGTWMWFGREGSEIAACEDYIKEELRSPSTYRRVSVAVHDEPTTAAQIAQMTERRAPSGESSFAIRTVDVSYDADNAYGTPVRGAQICGFVMRDGSMPDGAIVRANVAAAKLRRITRRLQEDRGSTPDSVGRYPCCM